MDKLRIFNLARSVFNLPLLTEAQLTECEEDPAEMAKHPDVQILELCLEPAIRKAMRERAWTFLDAELELGENKGASDGYRASYDLPEGLFRLTRADGRYRVSGGRLLTDGAPKAYGQMSKVPDEGVPEDFWDLVAYALATLAAPKISEGDNKTSYALTFYNTIRDTMVANDVQNQMREDREIANGFGSYV